MTQGDATVTVEVGFLPASEAISDPDHPGLLRAGPRGSAPYHAESIETHACRAIDGARPGSAQPDLFQDGFDTVDLAGIDALQEVCARLREDGRIADSDAATVRAALDGATLQLASGPTVTVMHVADEGLIMRKVGPNRLSLVGPSSKGMNDHTAASSIHADQDVFGTPLAQLMDGRAPELFRHDSPDGRNHEAGLMLVNLWIPLQQVVQPLVLGDGRSIDRRRHQLRYGLATDSFLERDGDQVINDIWTFLHDPDQRWYLRSDMDHWTGYVFNTLSTPHGSCTLPGEDIAEAWYLVLEAAESAIERGDAGALAEVLSTAPTATVPPDATPALSAAVEAMAAVLDEAGNDAALVCGDGAEEWSTRSRIARRRVTRMSLELRLVVSIGE